MKIVAIRSYSTCTRCNTFNMQKGRSQLRNVPICYAMTFTYFPIATSTPPNCCPAKRKHFLQSRRKVTIVVSILILSIEYRFRCTILYACKSFAKLILELNNQNLTIYCRYITIINKLILNFHVFVASFTPSTSSFLLINNLTSR